MQVYLMVIGIVVLFLFIAFLLGIRNEIVAEREFIADNRKNMGKAPNLKLSKARLAAIPRYSITHRDDNTIDDITWNDLGLDAVYERINYCKSGAGQEYLYHRLRTPKQSDDFVSEEKHIEHFSKNQKLSEKCMLILAKMGNSGKYSLYEYLDRLEKRANEIINRKACFSMKDLAVNGNDLIKLGVKPGKELGNILKYLLEAVIEGKLPNDKNTLIKFTKENYLN